VARRAGSPRHWHHRTVRPEPFLGEYVAKRQRTLGVEMEKLGFLLGAALVLFVTMVVIIRRGHHNEQSHRATRLTMGAPKPRPTKPREKDA